MLVLNAHKAADKATPHGVSVRPLHETQHVQIVHITLEPGESLKRHITPVDACFYVLEGRGIVEIGEERRACVADDLIASPARIPHRWLNEGTATLRILVVKTPRQTEASRIL
ncbi:MAG: cupin domain-containing protein [Candidatus Eisenbacteria bacterium]|jgi:quercetin dioxygenase-like cupin family protein|nr:cupin domain-containing protein [Candidatus Eisenbacteria bacterium]